MTHPARATSPSTPSPMADSANFRPKVLRRPASLNPVEVAPSEPVVALPTATPSIAPQTARKHPASVASAKPPRPWQEDTPFGIAMVAMLLVMNLMLALTMGARSNPGNDLPISMLPSPTSGAAPVAEVTTYARPAAAPTPSLRRAVHVLGDESTAPLNE